ncbi:hypothetical protein N9W61_00815 [Algibacter sp.]|nr:hypothetical protein [Algibacter sp.]
MHIKITILLIIASLNIVLSQEDKTTTEYAISDEVNINNEVLPFSNYFSEYKLNENWVLRAENIETNFGGLGATYMVKDVPLLAKYNISEKFSVLFGPTLNLLLINGAVEDVTTSGTIGVQYDFTESFLMEARFNQNLSSETSLQTKLPTTNSLLKLGAKYKF